MATRMRPVAALHIHGRFWRGVRCQSTTREAASSQKLVAQLPVGIGFSAAGLLFPYYVGCGKALTAHGVLTPQTKLAGASAGSLIAASLVSGRSTEDVLDALRHMVADLRQSGTRGRLKGVLERILRDLLPEDIADRARGRCFVAVTRLSGSPRRLLQGELVSEFEDKSDFIAALLTSCFIPFYFHSLAPATRFRGAWCADGGLSQFLPTPPLQLCPGGLIRVSTFPTYTLSGMGVDICPDAPGVDGAPTPVPYDMSRLLQWALTPATDEVLDALVAQGEADAGRWVARMGLGRGP
jgi:hypothetical protein